MNEKQITYFLDGKIYTEWLENGLKKAWFINGNINYHFFRIDGNRQGIMQRWNENGSRWFIKSFRDNQSTGPCILFRY